MPPKEFTAEVNEDFYNSLARKIKDRGVTRAGTARSEALSRGLGGDPYEASAVGLANQGTDAELANLDSSLAYNVAGLGREERLSQQSRGWQVEDRNFGAAENEKDRAFRERMARLNQDWMGDQANTENRRSMQAALWQIPLGGAAKGLGGWMGGL